MICNEYDWNQIILDGDSQSSFELMTKPIAQFEIFDESLRDGIQSPAFRNPTLAEKFKCIEKMCSVGITSADLGFPGASEHALNECISLVKFTAENTPGISIGLAGRTHPNDITSICKVANATNINIEAYLFVGVSGIRQYVEGWDFHEIRKRIIQSATQCNAEGLEFVLVLEDVVRSSQDLLSKIYLLAIELTIKRIVLCDTVGCALPTGTYSVVKWTKNFFARNNYSILLDWHGHNDRGLALINSLVATSQGCNRIHGTVLGIGERAGNTALDHLIMNYHLLGWKQFDLFSLKEYCDIASDIFSQIIPKNYPVFGDSVFKTSAGVHASAIYKAEMKAENDLHERIYTSISATSVGKKQEIVIDASSGVNNVKHWLRCRGITVNDDVLPYILDIAKSSNKIASDADIMRVINEHKAQII